MPSTAQLSLRKQELIELIKKELTQLKKEPPPKFTVENEPKESSNLSGNIIKLENTRIRQIREWVQYNAMYVNIWFTCKM